MRFGGDFQLKNVQENGEYQEARLEDQAEGLKVERRGRTITLSFEAVINDDMGAFLRIPREFAMTARVMESSMVWGLIRTNAKTKSDGKALFHAEHRNLAAAAGPISVETIGAARKAMWEQTAFGSKDAEDCRSRSAPTSPPMSRPGPKTCRARRSRTRLPSFGRAPARSARSNPRTGSAPTASIPSSSMSSRPGSCWLR
nr:hypothetical protein [Rhodovulum sulfidophilum]